MSLDSSSLLSSSSSLSSGSTSAVTPEEPIFSIGPFCRSLNDPFGSGDEFSTTVSQVPDTGSVTSSSGAYFTEPQNKSSPFTVTSVHESLRVKSSERNSPTTLALGGDGSEIVTALAGSSRIVVSGTARGDVIIHDVDGHVVHVFKQRHNGPVGAIALGGGSFGDDILASVGQWDSTLVVDSVFSIHDTSQLSSTACSYRHVLYNVDSLTNVVVDPMYFKARQGRRICIGGSNGKVIIHTRSKWLGISSAINNWSSQLGFFGIKQNDPHSNNNNKDIAGADAILCKGEGAIMDMAWSPSGLLAWMTTTSVRIFDMNQEQGVCRIQVPAETIAIGWHSSYRFGLDSTALDSPSRSMDSYPTSFHPTSNTGSTVESVHSAFSDRLEVRGKMALVWANSNTTFPGNSSLARKDIEILYITWPTCVKIYQVVHSGSDLNNSLTNFADKSPVHEDHAALSSQMKPNSSVSVLTTINRKDVIPSLVDGSQGVALKKPGPQSSAQDLDGVFLRVVPFGEKYMAALMANSSSYHLILLPESPVSSMSSKFPSIQIDMLGVEDADIVHIPGGDPLMMVWSRSSSGMVPKYPSIMFVKTLSAPERVRWMLAQGRFSDALVIAQAAPRGSLRAADVSIEDVGEKYLEYLKSIGDDSKLAEILPRVIDSTTPPFHHVSARSSLEKEENKRKRWIRWMGVFSRSSKMYLLADKLPTSKPKLGDGVYDEILIDLAKDSPETLLKILKLWPEDTFSVATVTRAVESSLKTYSERNASVTSLGGVDELRDALLLLYSLGGRRDQTLNLLLQEKSPDVFKYIQSHELYEAIRSKESISCLFSIDENQATALLARAPETLLPPDAVVPILTETNNESWLHSYLHAYYRRDKEAIATHHGLLLSLYCKFGPPGALMTFLQSSTNYSLEAAMDSMSKAQKLRSYTFANERAFVLTRMGALTAVMDILVHEMNDISAAIDYGKKHADSELWGKLVDFAKEDVNTLGMLLDSCTGHVDPLLLISLIKPDMKIPNLRDRLHRILVDAALERSLREGTARVLSQDADILFHNLERNLRQWI